MHRWLIIPIETKVRELHSKCLLAAEAASAGFQVVLGDQRVISQSLHQLPRGIYLDKSISRTKTAHYRRLRNLGFSVTAWCEEGLLYRDRAKYQLERVYPESLKLLDAFFAWGNVHRADVIDADADRHSIIHVYGNPRFDLLRPVLRTVFADEARELEARFGPYILVNTNFSMFNRFPDRESRIEVLRARRISLTDDQKAFYDRFINHLGMVFGAFAEMIPRLAEALPDHTIIVRPHPSENHDRWREQLAGLDNVEVHPEGNVLPWIMGARAVIHNACTTGVESLLLDRPTIAYVPIVDQEFNRLSYLPNAISNLALTADEVVAKAQSATKENAVSAPSSIQKDLMAQHVASLEGPLASEKIVRTLLDIPAKNVTATDRLRSAATRFYLAGRKVAVSVRNWLRPNKPLQSYMDQKFPALTREEVSDVLMKIATAQGNNASYRVGEHPHLPDCFLISPDR